MEKGGTATYQANDGLQRRIGLIGRRLALALVLAAFAVLGSDHRGSRSLDLNRGEGSTPTFYAAHDGKAVVRPSDRLPLARRTVPQAGGDGPSLALLPAPQRLPSVAVSAECLPFATIFPLPDVQRRVRPQPRAPPAARLA